MRTRQTRIGLGMAVAIALLASCTPSTSIDSSIEKTKKDLAALEQKLDSVPENDPVYVAQLEEQLNGLDQSIEQIGTKLESAGDQISDDTREAWKNVKSDSEDLREKLSDWTDKAGEKLDDLGDSIQKGVQDIKMNTDDKN